LSQHFIWFRALAPALALSTIAIALSEIAAPQPLRTYQWDNGF
jgi:hypothetical protein